MERCIGCLCNTCVNNSSNLFRDKSKIICDNCEDCHNYDLKSDKTINYKHECKSYIIPQDILERRAEIRRNKVRLIKK